MSNSEIIKKKKRQRIYDNTKKNKKKSIYE